MDETNKTEQNLDLILDVPVKMSVEIGSRQILMKDLLQMAPGTVINLEKLTDSPVDIYVNNKFIGRGEIMVLENQIAVKVIELATKSQ